MQGKLHRYVAAATAAGIFVLGIAAGSASASEADIKYRQAVMKALGGHMGAVAAIVKGEVSHEDHVKNHAEAIAAMGSITKDIFPEDSKMGETKALPAIWEKPDDFAKAVSAFQTASANFADAANGGDMEGIKAAFGQLGQSCGGCHKPFRGK